MAGNSGHGSEGRPHKRLHVWQAAVDLVVQVNETTGSFPQSERFVLVPQMNRAALSVPSNIAEGAARKGRNEYLHFLYVARASISELDTQLEIAKRLGYLSAQKHEALQVELDRVAKMLNALIGALCRSKSE
jgi:four helix bundle protein